MAIQRSDHRKRDELRPVKITRNYLEYPEGSVLVEFGRTQVIVTASVEEKVPKFLEGSGRGWVTAEYGMLPRSTQERIPRGRVDGRSYEIQRLVGRSLRAVADLEALGQRTVRVDCDVLQADGGTRSAAITGAYVALFDAFRWMQEREMLARWPLETAVAGVSVGMVDGEPVLDLDYGEDSRAEVDFNVVMTDRGRFVEVQGAAEGEPFRREDLDALLSLSWQGLEKLFALQRAALGLSER